MCVGMKKEKWAAIEEAVDKTFLIDRNYPVADKELKRWEDEWSESTTGELMPGFVKDKLFKKYNCEPEKGEKI